MIRHRERVAHSSAAGAHGELMASAQAMISRMDVDRAYHVTKAFAIYFELTNLAETNHRKRRRRARQLDRQSAPLPGSFHGTLLRMKQAGMSAEAALAALRQVTVTPVFTAHPTEVARQTVLLKRRRIAEQLERLDRSSPHPRRSLALRTDHPCRDYRALAERRSSADQAHRGRRDPHGIALFSALSV